MAPFHWIDQLSLICWSKLQLPLNYRMIPELVSFVILLVVFILAYGLASQALINPAQVDFCLFVAFVDFFVGFFVDFFVSFFVGFFVDFFVGFFNLIGGVLRTGHQALSSILSQLPPL